MNGQERKRCKRLVEERRQNRGRCIEKRAHQIYNMLILCIQCCDVEHISSAQEDNCIEKTKRHGAATELQLFAFIHSYCGNKSSGHMKADIQ